MPALLSKVGDRGGYAIAAVAVIAFLLRATRLLQDGWAGPLGHDDEVYFSAAALLANGQIPYGDFVLLHPPGILVVIAPIAWFGEHVVGYLDALAIARWLGCCVGAINTALVGYLALRWRGAMAGVIAAALYAAFPPAIEQERLILLEPIVNLALLLGLTQWLSRDEETRSRTDILATGSLIGLAGAVKLTGGSMLLACLLVGPFERAVRHRVALVASAAVAFLIVASPFALRGGVEDFVEQVFVTQIERPTEAGDIPLGEITGTPERSLSMLAFVPDPGTHLPAIAGLLLLALGVGIAAWGWSRGGRVGRFLAVMWAITAAELLLAPKFYEHYALLLAPANCLLIGGAVQATYAFLSPSRNVRRWAVVAAAAAIPVFSAVTTLKGESPGPIPEVAGAEISDESCVYAPSPGLAIAADRLPVVADPGGESLYLAVREGNPRTQSDALRSVPAQRRLREVLSGCDYVLLHAGPPPSWSPRTRASFHADYGLVSRSSESVEIWRRGTDDRSGARQVGVLSRGGVGTRRGSAR